MSPSDDSDTSPPPSSEDSNALAAAGSDADSAGPGDVSDPVIPCGAPRPAPGTQPTPKPPGNLIVLVVDSSNAPVDLADVSIQGPTPKTGKTVSNAKGKGRVEFHGLVDGAYTISVTKTFKLAVKAVSTSPALEFGKSGDSISAQGSGNANVPAGGTATATVQLPTALTVTELGFSGDYPLTEWATKSAISAPHWKQAGNPNKPVCYKMESASLSLDAKVSMGTDLNISSIGLTSGKLEKKVQITMLTLDWSYTLDGGASIPANSTGPHKVYQVYDTPKQNPLYDLALEKSCGKCSGESAIPDIAPKISDGIHADLTYRPAIDVPGSPPLGIYSHGGCQCINNADLLVYLCQSCGFDAEVVWIWGGKDANEVRYYHGTTPVYGSFRVIAPKNGDAVQNPHFTFHAQVRIDGTVYDPSYGGTGLLVLNETAPSAARQTGPAYPPSNKIDLDPAVWKCPH